MIRNRPVFLCLNKLEAKLIAKALRYTASHDRAEIGFVEYQMFKELTKRTQGIARGEEREDGLNDFRIFHARGLGKNEIIEVLRVIVTGCHIYRRELII